jgi:hypothetical protein
MDKYFKMKNGFNFGPITIYSTKQKTRLGEAIADAISEGRDIEIRQGKNKSILVLLSPADNLGNVYKINERGCFQNIGVTEKPLGE